MSEETTTTAGQAALKNLNWSKLISFLVGFFGPAIAVYMSDIHMWLLARPALAPLAAVPWAIQGWISARGTAKGTLKKGGAKLADDIPTVDEPVDE